MTESAHDAPDAGNAAASSMAASSFVSPGAPGSLYVTTAYQPDMGPSAMFALNAADGSLRWRRDYGDVAAGAPALAGGVLYQGLQDGSVSAIRASDGATTWRVMIGVPAAYSRLLLSDDVLYVQAGDGLYALKATDGAPLERPAPGYSLPPSAAPAVAGNVFLQDRLDVVQVRASDGALGWRFAVPPRSLDGDDMAYYWTVGHGHVYVLNMSDYQEIALYALNVADGSVAWRYPSLKVELTQQWQVQVVAVDEDSVYLLSNGGEGYASTQLYALDPADGSVRWRAGQVGAAFKYGKLFHGVLYLTVASTGELVAFEPRDGRLRWRQALGPYDNSLLLLNGDQIFVDSLHAGLFVLDVSSGETLWQYPTTQSVWVLAVVAGIVYLAVSFNALHLPPGSHYLCALRESDRAAIWRYDVPTFFGALVGP